MQPTYIERIVRFGFGLLATALLLTALVRFSPGGPVLLGVSVHSKREVADLVSAALPVTLASVATGVAFALPLALLLGVPAGLRPNSLLDRVLQGPAVALAGVPAFTMALLTIRSLAIEARAFSLPGAARVALVLLLAAWMARAIRNALAAARVDGALQGAGRVAMAVLGRILQQTGNLLVVTMLVELPSASPGILRLVIQGVMMRDIPVVYGALWALIPCALVGHLAGDLLVTASVGKGGAQGRISRSWLVAGGLLAAVLLITPLVGSGDPMELVLADRLKSPSAQHLLGTDQFGRDLLSRVGYGARTSLVITGVATFLATVAGAVLATVGWAGGQWGRAIFTPRTAAPNLFVPLIAGLVGGLIFGPSILTLMISLGVASIPSMAQAFRQLFQPGDRGSAFAAAAGLMVLTAAQIMMAEMALSFLGVGVQPPTPSLGSLVFDSTQYVRNAPYLLWGAVPGALGMAGLFLIGHSLAGSTRAEQ